MEITGTITKILVPTDFSNGSAKAWKTALQLAVSVGAELVLVHVLPTTPLDIETIYREEERFAELRSRQAAHQIGIPRTDAPPQPSRVFHGPLSGEGVKGFSPAGREWGMLLEEWADAARRDGVKVTTLLRVGVPYREVVDAAAAEGVDLVPLATHGRGEIHRLLVGSVADKVIRMAPCPVMTIRDAA